MANEKRLIDANKLKEKAEPEEVTGEGIVYVQDIDEAPTVDAVEVVHGRWVLQRYYGGMRKGVVARIICSECGCPNEETNYCPNCGAKMDGDKT